MIKLTEEREITLYAKVGDYNGFKDAERNENIQELSTRIEGKGKFRARKYVSENGTSYKAGVKGNSTGDTVKKAIDEETSVSAAYFEANRLLADQMTIRDRFTFNGSTAKVTIKGETIAVPPVEYQVDVFLRFDGRESEWIKIDIELDKFYDAIKGIEGFTEDVDITLSVAHLPFKPQEVFIACKENSDEQRAIIAELWKEFSQTPDGGPITEVKTTVMEQKEPPATITNPPVDQGQAPLDNEGNDDGQNNI